MTNKFQITSQSAEPFYSAPASRWAEFRNLLLDMRNAGTEELGRFFVSGKEVSFDAALAAADDAQAAFLAKREQTHRQITVHMGASSCPGTYHKVWVRK